MKCHNKATASRTHLGLCSEKRKPFHVMLFRSISIVTYTQYNSYGSTEKRKTKNWSEEFIVSFNCVCLKLKEKLFCIWIFFIEWRTFCLIGFCMQIKFFVRWLFVLRLDIRITSHCYTFQSFLKTISLKKICVYMISIIISWLIQNNKSGNKRK